MLQLQTPGPAQQAAGRGVRLGVQASQTQHTQSAGSQPRQGVQARAAAGFAVPAPPQPSPGRLWNKSQPRLAEKQQRQQDAKVAASSKSSHSNSKPHQTGTGISLFAPYENLPPDGLTRTEGDSACDPETQRCKSVMHTWESKCAGCSGTGLSKSRGARRGSHASLHSCIMCHGTGYLRHTSSKVLPDLGNGAYMTIGRQPGGSNGKPSGADNM